MSDIFPTSRHVEWVDLSLIWYHEDHCSSQQPRKFVINSDPLRLYFMYNFHPTPYICLLEISYAHIAFFSDFKSYLYHIRSKFPHAFKCIQAQHTHMHLYIYINGCVCARVCVYSEGALACILTCRKYVLYNRQYRDNCFYFCCRRYFQNSDSCIDLYISDQVNVKCYIS